MTRLEEAIEKIDLIYEILVGNGKPEGSIVFKVAEHEKFISFWKKFGWQLCVGALTIPPAVVTYVVIALIKQ